MYVSADAKYLFSGDIIEVEGGRNLTEEVKNKARIAAIDAVGEDQMIIFSPPKDQIKHTINVFTDIDCGFCRRLHSEMDQYNARGIKVRYLFFPRAGVKSHSYEKAVSVWCADDRKAAMTLAKNGAEPEAKTCENPVKAQFELGSRLGVTGTPAMVLENGQLLPGYVPADRMSAYLDQLQAQQQAQQLAQKLSIQAKK